MHCPNCAKETGIGQKFCRSCGMNLEAVSKALAEHYSNSGIPAIQSTQERAAVSGLARRMFLGVAILLAGGLIGAINGILFDHNRVGQLGSIMVVLSGILLVAYAVISPMWQQPSLTKPSGRAASTNGSETDETVTNRGLPPIPESVTDRTTNILEPESVGRIHSDPRLGGD
jgi:hypothetical protein